MIPWKQREEGRCELEVTKKKAKKGSKLAHLGLDLPLVSRHLVSQSSSSHLSSVVLEETDNRDVVGDLRFIAA